MIGRPRNNQHNQFGHFRTISRFLWTLAVLRNNQHINLVISGAVGASPVLSRTFNRLPRAVGAASVPAGDRAALVGSAKPLIISLYSSASGPGVSCAGGVLASSAIPRASKLSAIKLRSRYQGNPSPI